MRDGVAVFSIGLEAGHADGVLPVAGGHARSLEDCSGAERESTAGSEFGGRLIVENWCELRRGVKNERNSEAWTGDGERACGVAHGEPSELHAVECCVLLIRKDAEITNGCECGRGEASCRDERCEKQAGRTHAKSPSWLVPDRKRRVLSVSGEIEARLEKWSINDA